MNRHNQHLHCLAAVVSFLCVAVSASAQYELRSLIPTIRKEMKGAYTEQYIRTDSDIAYSMWTETLPQASFSSSFQSSLRSAANADMSKAEESDYYINRKGGVRLETFTLSFFSLSMKSQLTLGDNVYFLFAQEIHAKTPNENISVPLDKYLSDNYARYATDNSVRSNFVEFVGKDGNSVVTPSRKWTYSIPAAEASGAFTRLRQWLRQHVQSTDYDAIYLLKDNVQIKYTSGKHANVYYAMLQPNGSLNITKFETDNNEVADEKIEASSSPAEGEGLIIKPDDEYYDVWNLPIANKSLTHGPDVVFSLERRSDETIMHIRKRIYKDALETWTDDSQTFLVDEDTQVHYMARGCTPKEIWGKMIRIMDMKDKTIAIDVYFPPLPSGVRRFTVWGLRRFGVSDDFTFYMKRDGDLYIDR